MDNGGPAQVLSKYEGPALSRLCFMQMEAAIDYGLEIAIPDLWQPEEAWRVEFAAWLYGQGRLQS